MHLYFTHASLFLCAFDVCVYGGRTFPCTTKHHCVPLIKAWWDTLTVFASRAMQSILDCGCAFVALGANSLQILFSYLIIWDHLTVLHLHADIEFWFFSFGSEKTFNKLKEGLKALKSEEPLRLKETEALWGVDSAIHSLIQLITE